MRTTVVLVLPRVGLSVPNLLLQRASIQEVEGSRKSGIMYNISLFERRTANNYSYIATSPNVGSEKHISPQLEMLISGPSSGALHSRL